MKHSVQNKQKLFRHIRHVDYKFRLCKVITTGEGIILTNSRKIYELSKEYHDHGHKNIKNLPRGLDKSNFAGFNYRMTEMHVIGKVQLSKLKIISLNKVRFNILSKFWRKII